MCPRKFVLFACVFVCCSALFALPQFGSSRNLQPTVATTPAAPEAAEPAPEQLSVSSPAQPAEESIKAKKGIFSFFRTEEAVADLEAVNDIQAAVIEERDAELDKVQKESVSFKPVFGLGSYTYPYSEEPTVGIQGIVGVKKGNWALLCGVGYGDITQLDDPKKECMMTQVMLVKAF